MSHALQFRYLYEAARLGTMRAASEQLNVATSSISRQIASLEKDIGMPLIEGGRRRIKLTEVGQAAFDYYREKCAHEEVFRMRIEELRNVRAGKIQIAVGEAFITDQFSQLLHKYMREFPGMSVQVRMSGSNSVVDLVREDEAHFGLIFDLPRDPKVQARLHLSQPLRVMVHPKHALAARDSVKLNELAGAHSIALPEESFRIRQIMRAAEAADAVFLEPELVANSIALLKDFVKFGLGITVLPAFLAQPELAAGTIKALPVDNAVLSSTHVSLITRIGRQLPMGVYRFMQQVEGYLKRSIAEPH